MKKLIVAALFLIFCVSESPAAPREGGKYYPSPYRYHHNNGDYDPHYDRYRYGPGHYYIRYHPYGYRHHSRGYDDNRRWFDFYFNDYGDRRFEGWYY